MMHKKNERRGTPRLPFASRITVGLGSSLYECRARDLGTGGLFIYFDGDAPPVDSKLNLAFKLDDADSGLEMTGRVVRHGSGGNGVGVAFVELSEKARARLEAYIATIAGGSPSSTDRTS